MYFSSLDLIFFCFFLVFARNHEFYCRYSWFFVSRLFLLLNKFVDVKLFWSIDINSCITNAILEERAKKISIFETSFVYAIDDFYSIEHNMRLSLNSQIQVSNALNNIFNNWNYFLVIFFREIIKLYYISVEQTS